MDRVVVTWCDIVEIQEHTDLAGVMAMLPATVVTHGVLVSHVNGVLRIASSHSDDMLSFYDIHIIPDSVVLSIKGVING